MGCCASVLRVVGVGWPGIGRLGAGGCRFVNVVVRMVAVDDQPRLTSGMNLSWNSSLLQQNMIKVFEAVIHFAGLKAVGESVHKPLMYHDNNLIGTIVLLEVMAAHGCKKENPLNDILPVSVGNLDPYDILAANWSSASPICNWIGVTCSRSHKGVAALNLANRGLESSIPPNTENPLNDILPVSVGNFDTYDILAANWSSASPICNWIGVTCGRRHKGVAALNLANRGLKSSIPPNTVPLSGYNFMSGLIASATASPKANDIFPVSVANLSTSLEQIAAGGCGIKEPFQILYLTFRESGLLEPKMSGEGDTTLYDDNGGYRCQFARARGRTLLSKAGLGIFNRGVSIGVCH
ncbi:hypothetical protein RJ640_023969 [Escallonia rubra]|uniref:Uncharacterized protein n=1 Tax=Escallonia rubra TaxID=112253 RepID=A0AA88R5Z8_9ASTE|nr:hypothetical protein RJ640_023969 [Escallonia rubra]